MPKRSMLRALFVRTNPLLLVLLLFVPAAMAQPARAADDSKRPEGFHDESEAGVVVLSGNSSSQSYNLGELGSYYWPSDLLKLQAKLLKTETGGVDTARSWSLGLRYERSLSELLSAYAG